MYVSRKAYYAARRERLGDTHPDFFKRHAERFGEVVSAALFMSVCQCMCVLVFAIITGECVVA
jgi:hypothetical protein